MPVEARLIGRWERSQYVLGCNEVVVGPIDVYGLEGVLDTIADLEAGRGTDFPDLEVTGLDKETKKWLLDWAQTRGTRRDLIIRDNKEDRWFYISGAWIQSGSDMYSVVLIKARLGEKPDWYWAAS